MKVTIVLFSCLWVIVSASKLDEAYCGTDNCYKILGLTREATTADIRRSYRQLSLQFHPDKNKSPDATDKFRAIAKANEVLANDELRQAYDYFLDHPEENMYGHYMRYYKAYYAPQTDARVVVLAVIAIVSVMQYMYQLRSHTETVRRLKALPRFKTHYHRKLEEIQQKDTQNVALRQKEIEDQVVDEMLEAEISLGLYSKPTVKNIMAVVLLRLPIILPRLIWNKWSHKPEPLEESDEDDSELTAELKAKRLAMRKARQEALQKKKEEETARAIQVQEEEMQKQREDKVRGAHLRKEKETQNSTLREDSRQDGVISNNTDWTPQELSQLAKGLVKYPGGMGRRWQLIAKYISTRSVDEVIEKAKTMAQGQSLASMGSKISSSAFQQFQQQDRVMKPIHAPPDARDLDTTPTSLHTSAAASASSSSSSSSSSSVSSTSVVTASSTSASTASEWSKAQQAALEDALRVYPSSLPANERWALIAKAVPNKTKKECVARFKELQEIILAKKTQA